MSEIRFSCPSCQQHIQCDTSYAGAQIDCPACKAQMIVPGTPPAPPPPPTSAASEPACPHCNSPLSPGASMCTNCGFNLRTGQRMVEQPPTPAGTKGAKKKKKKKRRPGADPNEEKWYASPWPYVGALALIFGLLFLAGKKNDGATLAFIGLAFLYCLGTHIAVVVHAFKNEGAGWAFLCFCIPFVGLYYVYKRSESPFLQALYGLVIILNIAMRFMDLDAVGEAYEDIPLEDDSPIEGEESAEEEP